MKARREQDEMKIVNKRKPGHQPLKQDIEKNVKEFYDHEDNSRQLAGMRDSVTVKGPDGNKTFPKKMVLCNLNELYAAFEETHPEIRIGFSKFTQLRPPHCVLAGTTGTHSSCLCLIHQNISLMLQGKSSICIKNIIWLPFSRILHFF